MKTKIYLILIMSCLLQTTIAQIKIEIDTVFTAIIEEPDLVGHNTFTNQIPQLKTFKWTRNILDITEGWSTAVCDKNLCYVPSIGSEEVELGPGASSLLDVHLYTNDIYDGYAFIELKIEDVADSNNYKFAYYLYDSNLPVSVNDINGGEFKVYPNPSEGMFFIEQAKEPIASIKIFDIAGAEILNISLGQQQWVELFQLKPGNYIFQLINRQREVLAIKMIAKL